MTRTLDQVLELAASNDSFDRMHAAEELGRFTGDRADAALAGLLDDRDNTAVCVAAAHAVLRRGDASSAEVLLRFLASGDENPVSHVLDELLSARELVERSGLRARAIEAFTANDPLVVAGARELRDEMGWWDGAPPPPATIDGWDVRLTADVREPVATCDGLHYVRDGYVSGIAHLVVAAHPAEPGTALLWCDHHWNALATTRHFDDGLAFEQAAFHFGAARFQEVGGGDPARTEFDGVDFETRADAAPGGTGRVGAARHSARDRERAGSTLYLEAIVTVVPAEEDGRTGPTVSGYRPPVWFGQFVDDGVKQCWDFRLTFPGLGDETPTPVGEPVVAHLRASFATFADLPVRVGQPFEALEGSRATVRGRVTRVLDR
jgi:hypothetical protein